MILATHTFLQKVFLRVIAYFSPQRISHIELFMLFIIIIIIIIHTKKTQRQGITTKQTTTTKRKKHTIISQINVS